MHSVDLALKYGRSLQSSQTGFVHYCHEAHEGPPLTIPVLENALFAHALFRTRLSENVLEGKEIIERLLAFEKEGNFPVYLHDYPIQKDPYLGMHLLPVFYWLMHDFSHVIGELKEKLKSVIERILLQAHGSDLPPWARFRLMAFDGQIGELPEGQVEWGEALISLQIAESILQALKKCEKCQGGALNLSQALPAPKQLNLNKLSDGGGSQIQWLPDAGRFTLFERSQYKGIPIEEALLEAAKLWHPTLQLYVGPSIRRHQEGSYPEFTLFDFYMCEWQKQYPERGERMCPVHLKGSLIRPLKAELLLEEKPEPFFYFGKDEEFPLFIAWGVHTFVLAKKHLEASIEGEFIHLTYPEELPDTEDKSFELNFYFNIHPDHAIFVNGKKASSFRFGDLVTIHSKEAQLELRFFAEEGKYFGHFMRGNRPSQHGVRGESEFAAYDWRIAVRTVLRAPKAAIRVQVRLMPNKESQQPLPLHASHYPHTESSP